jgi:membrane protease YdiL (CAAX protease family)
MLSRRDIGTATSVMAVFAFGIFLVWFPLAVLKIPQPSGLVANVWFNAAWQTMATIVMPCAWAIWWLDLRLGDLGLTKRNLGHSVLMGCALYAVALVAFVHCSGDPLIANHPVRHLPPVEAFGLASAMSLIAAGTDLATRGFILLILARHTHVIFAIFIQNLVWFLGHLHEISLLTNCLGAYSAIGLTLTLGIVGDVIALKTRNVVGLAIAHILLNVLLSFYLRQL